MYGSDMSVNRKAVKQQCMNSNNNQLEAASTIRQPDMILWVLLGSLSAS